MQTGERGKGIHKSPFRHLLVHRAAFEIQEIAYTPGQPIDLEDRTLKLSIRLLGPLEILWDDAPAPLPQSRKTRALLAYLILTGRRHRRDRLCNLLWDIPDDPRGALRWSLSKLRPLVNEPTQERLVTDRDHVFFESKGATIDLQGIRRELAGGAESLATDRLLELVAMFRGELLEGLALPELRDFEAWLLTERDAARRTQASLLHALVPRVVAEPSRSLPLAQALVQADPYSLTAHAWWIRSLAAAGHMEEAENQYAASMRELEEAGTRDLGILARALRAQPPNLPVVDPVDTPPETESTSGEGRHGLQQTIRFCTATDGVRIGFATVGNGPPLVKTANWLNHLEHDWDSPIWRHVFRELARDHLLVRYDARGNGLSDWDVDELSFEAFVRDLESVVDAAGVGRFPLLGISQGCAISIEYAIRHPERVTRLVLHGGYARGWRVGTDVAEIARREALQTLILHGWGQDNPAFRQVFTSAFIPGGTPEQFRWMNELQRISISPHNAIRLQQALGTVDIRDRLLMVQVPTLVLHSRRDGRIPYQKGLELAQGIPNARLVTLDSDNHLLLEHEPEFPRFMEAIRSFLAEDRPPS